MINQEEIAKEIQKHKTNDEQYMYGLWGVIQPDTLEVLRGLISNGIISPVSAGAYGASSNKYLIIGFSEKKLVFIETIGFGVPVRYFYLYLKDIEKVRIKKGLLLAKITLVLKDGKIIKNIMVSRKTLWVKNQSEMRRKLLNLLNSLA